MKEPHLVLVETSANQRFIFATNKLRENVGASHMIWRAGVELTLKAVAPRLFDTDPRTLRTNLRNAHRDIGDRIEILTVSSGKALFRLPGREEAEQVVESVTRAALSELPGVEVRGAVQPCDGLSCDEAVQRVHGRLAELRAHIPGPEARFLRLPVVAACSASPYPASDIDGVECEYAPGQPDAALVSTVSKAKRVAYTVGIKRLHAPVPRGIDLPRTIEQLERLLGRVPADATSSEPIPRLEWLGVIHADGNGIGQIFQRFGTHARAQEWPDYARKMLEFSLALDECGEQAFGEALEKALERRRQRSQRHPANPLAVVPLVLGGDDLTVVCDGAMAVQFARDYLQTFERRTAASQVISAIAGNALPAPQLGACAGIAIVKPHFPFHLAYELTEALALEAKSVKKRVQKAGQPLPCCALDFHVHYDASGADLERIRDRLLLDEGATSLLARPYVVTLSAALAGADDRTWADAHALNRLEQGILRLHADDEETRIPRTVLHELREALFFGHSHAADRCRMLLKRRPTDGNLRELLIALGHDREDEEPGLFRSEPPDSTAAGQPVRVSALLDAMDLQGLWQ